MEKFKVDTKDDIAEEPYKGPSIAVAAAGEGFLRHFAWAVVGIVVGGVASSLAYNKVGAVKEAFQEFHGANREHAFFLKRWAAKAAGLVVEVCITNKVTHVVLAGGVPKGATITRLKEGGAKVICFAPTAALGKKLVKMGADALIIEGAEAGGHIGPVSTSVLAQEILPLIRDVPVFVAGGIGRGEAIVSYLEMGASGVQLGTRFVCAKESIAHENFKKAFINANARDAMPSVQYHPDFPVIPVRAIVNKASEEFTRFQKETVEKVFAGAQSKEEGQLAIEHFWAGSLRKAVIEGDVERGSLMAGQSVGMVQCIQTAQEIVDELVQQAALYLEKKAAA